MTDSEYSELIIRICMSGRALDALCDISEYARNFAEKQKSDMSLAKATIRTVRKIADQNIPGDNKNRIEIIAAVTEPEECNINLPT